MPLWDSEKIFCSVSLKLRKKWNKNIIQNYKSNSPSSWTLFCSWILLHFSNFHAILQKSKTLHISFNKSTYGKIYCTKKEKNRKKKSCQINLTRLRSKLVLLQALLNKWFLIGWEMISRLFQSMNMLLSPKLELNLSNDVKIAFNC